MPCLCPPTTPAVEVYCCEALPAWEQGRRRVAIEAALRARALDPSLDAAEDLLYEAGYRDPIVVPKPTRPLTQSLVVAEESWGFGFTGGTAGLGWRLESPVVGWLWASAELIAVAGLPMGALCGSAGVPRDVPVVYVTGCGVVRDGLGGGRPALGIQLRNGTLPTLAIEGGALATVFDPVVPYVSLNILGHIRL